MTKAILTAGDSRMITGLFKDRESAERAFLIAIDRGYDKGEINVVMDDDTRQKYFPPDQVERTELASKAAEGGELAVRRAERWRRCSPPSPPSVPACCFLAWASCSPDPWPQRWRVPVLPLSAGGLYRRIA